MNTNRWVAVAIMTPAVILAATGTHWGSIEPLGWILLGGFASWTWRAWTLIPVVAFYTLRWGALQFVVAFVINAFIVLVLLAITAV